MRREVIRLGNIYGFMGGNYAGTVYQKDGLAPTLRAHTGGNTEPMIIERTVVAMRGRNPDNPSDRTAGSPTEQRLEPNSQGICNTLTSVQKDNMVLENYYLDENNYNQTQTVHPSNGICRTIMTGGSHCGNEPKIVQQHRIRKLTERECWRLMGFSDDDFEKAASVNSKTQLYKQAGNAIAENCLVAIFSQLGIKGVQKWNDGLKDGYARKEVVHIEPKY